MIPRLAESRNAETKRPRGAGPALATPLALVLIWLCEMSLSLCLLLIAMQASGDGAWLWIVGLVPVATVAAFFTSIWLARYASPVLSPTIYRASELIVLLAALRVWTWLVFDSGPGLENVLDLFGDPLGLIDVDFVVAACAIVLAWERSAAIGSLFEAGRQEVTGIDDDVGSSADGTPGRTGPRAELARAYTRIWLWGAYLLAACAVVAQFDVARWIGLGSGAEHGSVGVGRAIVAALFLYYVAGAWLVSNARLMEMMAVWRLRQARLQEPVPHRWRVGSLKLVLGAAALAAIVPGSAVLPLARYAADAWNGLLLAVELMFLPIVAFIAAIHWLFGTDEVADPATNDIGIIGNLQPDAMSATDPSAGNSGLFIGPLLWLFLLLLVALSVVHVMRQRGAFDGGRLLRSLNRWFQRVWQGLVRLRMERRFAGGRAAEMRFVRASPGRAGAARQRSRADGPRDKVLHAYLSLMRWADDRGVGRHPAMTPTEYARRFADRWPAMDPEIALITGTFEASRYSRDAITRDDVALVKTAFRRIRQHARTRTVPTAAGRGPLPVGVADRR